MKKPTVLLLPSKSLKRLAHDESRIYSICFSFNWWKHILGNRLDGWLQDRPLNWLPPRKVGWKCALMTFSTKLTTSYCSVRQDMMTFTLRRYELRVSSPLSMRSEELQKPFVWTWSQSNLQGSTTHLTIWTIIWTPSATLQKQLR